MHDVYLWTAYLVGTAAAAVTIKVIVSRLFDRQRERRYVPPSALYTEVWTPPLVFGGIIQADRRVFVAEPDPVELVVPLPKLPDASAWALDALSDVRKTASEDTYATLGEFAGRTHATVIPIWAEIHGRRHAQGLAVA
jgi:hypothetical protein